MPLARERPQFYRGQFEYNAARAAIALLPELVTIDQLKDIDDEAKYGAAARDFSDPRQSPLRATFASMTCASRSSRSASVPFSIFPPFAWSKWTAPGLASAL